MLTVRAHIENNNYESVLVRILGRHTGAVFETYEIQRKPSEETLREAYDWINSKYLNIDISTQGFSGNITKNKFNSSGKLSRNRVDECPRVPLGVKPKSDTKPIGSLSVILSALSTGPSIVRSISAY